MKTKINIQYTTERGTIFPTYQEALIADALEKAENVYLEDYKLKNIVTCLSNRFTVTELHDNEPSSDNS
jgi:hypothetical protein